MKYTFEIMKEYVDAFKGISVYSVSEDKKLMVDFVAREELEDAQKKIDEAYQRGLDDAWEAAKKISLMPPDEIEKVFPGAAKYNRYNLGYSGVEVIAKLKAYEEIKVGDEVTDIQSGANFLVTHLWESNHGDKGVSGFNNDCSAFSATLDKVSKTGRHFDIDKILEEMKE